MKPIIEFLWEKKPSVFEQVVTIPTVFLDIISQKAAFLEQCVTENINHIAFPEDIQKICEWSHGSIEKLKHQSGFIIFKCDPTSSDDQLRWLYRLISKGMGILNDRYGFFFDVVDQGLDYTKQAIPVSKTNAKTGYHTDSTAHDYYPDVVGLLCLSPAFKGGDSLITNAANLYQYLKENFPHHLKTVSQPLLRDVITPGSINNKEAISQNKFPVFDVSSEKFVARYMRYWIESAYQKTGQAPPSLLNEALDIIDNFFDSPENTVQFRMERGDMLFLNNTFLCHNRTAFDNGDGLQAPRKLVRTWLNFN